MFQPDKHLPVLRLASRVLYVLAVIGLVVGALMALSLANGAAAVPAVTLGLQSPLLKPFWDMMVSGLRLFGVLLFLGSVLVSAVIATCGLLLARSVSLSLRVQALEAELARLTAPAPAANGSSVTRPAASTLQAK